VRSVRFALVCLTTLLVALTPAATASAAKHRKPRPDPVRHALNALRGKVPATTLNADRDIYTMSMTKMHRLHGVRRRELRSVLMITQGIARRGALTAGRLPAVFLTLQRNAQWWASHGPPVAGSPGEKGAKGRTCKPLALARASRLSFPGDSVVWQYYPGLGLQLQVNGTFGNANALLQTKTAAKHRAAASILDQMRGLASVGGSLTTWEYLFPFGGGRPPWRSGLAQATAIRAYLNGATVLNRPDLRDFARRLTGLFAARTPVGVKVGLGRDGNWYALYSFAPGQQVLNAQLNAVIALHDLDQATGDGRAHALARDGLRATRRRIASFNTGVWSRYAFKGPLADLNYHVLNRDLARQLCDRTDAQAICHAAQSFGNELERRCPRAGRPPVTGPVEPEPTTTTTPATPTPTATTPTPTTPTGGTGEPTATTPAGGGAQAPQ
jgi:hypothetical protein